ncbi:MAG: Rrf2 family transcriptional regulator [Chloroflexi bacterium]|nr:Rrf2 family transcriptional regulator [Chloroflexota bacterium]
MKLSTKGEYAMRALLDLALHGDEGLVQTSDIADRTDIPVKYLEQIMLSLKSAGMLTSKRGIGGGYALARPAEEISVGDVLRLLEGTPNIVSCAGGSMGTCPEKQTCSIRSVLMEVRDAMARVVDQTSFADLASRSKELKLKASERLMYHI